MNDHDRIAARIWAQADRNEKRVARIMRPGVVESYDASKHRARVRLNGGSADALLTPNAPIIEGGAGKQTSRTTLTAGQTVWVFCPNGDIRNAQIFAGTFSDTYKSSSNAAEETRFERGSGRMAVRPDQTEVTHGDGIVRVADGNVFINC